MSMTDYSTFTLTVDLEIDCIRITCRLCPPRSDGKVYMSATTNGEQPHHRLRGDTLVRFMDEHWRFLHEDQTQRGGNGDGPGTVPERPTAGGTAPLVHRHDD